MLAADKTSSATDSELATDRLLIARALLADLIVAIQTRDPVLEEPEIWSRIAYRMGCCSDMLEAALAERYPELVSQLWQPH